jgi:DNA (cytosine-5)-methyltransferase 3A
MIIEKTKAEIKHETPPFGKPLLGVVLSLFDGMSCGQIALNRAGISYGKYYASEIDKQAIKVTQHNYPNTIQIGSVTDIKGTDLPQVDLLMGGSPCQSFSNAGKGEGFEGKSGLFWEYVRILKEVKPTYFLLENVKMKKEWKDIISKELGVEPIEINSALLSAQNRPRLYWTNIPNVTLPQDKGILFKDIINDSYEFKPLTKWFFSKWGEKQKIDTLKTINAEKSFCLTTNKSHSKNYYLNTDKTMARMLERDEAEKLQTIPNGYTNIVSKTDAHKMIGNGWTVDVIAHIFGALS